MGNKEDNLISYAEKARDALLVRRAKAREYYWRNREAISAKRKIFYKRNRKRLLAYQNEYNRSSKTVSKLKRIFNARHNTANNSRGHALDYIPVS